VTTVGCCGFPVSRSEYYRRFSTVELNAPFYVLPRVETAKKWRSEAPEGFVFCLKAWQLITHPSTSPTYRRLAGKLPPRPERCGHFQDTDEVRGAWERVSELAEALHARFILFQTPASFHPGASHLRDLYRFFKRIRRRRSVFVWEPRGGWDDRVVSKVCADLDLVHGADPLLRRALGSAVPGGCRSSAPGGGGRPRYFRMHGRMEGRRLVYSHAYSDAELEALRRLCAGAGAFVYFNNAEMWRDAGRFRELMEEEDVRVRGTVPLRRAAG